MKVFTSLVIIFSLLFGMGNKIMANSDDLKEADNLFENNRYYSARELYKQVAMSANKSGEISNEIEALSQIALCYLLGNEKYECTKWLYEAKLIADDNYPLGWSRYLKVRGKVEWWQNDYKNKSIRTFIELFNYCADANLNERAIKAIYAFYSLGTQKQQIEWFSKGIKLAEERNITKKLGPLWFNLAFTYSEMENWEASVDGFKKSLEYNKNNKEVLKLSSHYHIGWALKMKGDHKEALIWLQSCLEFAERLGDDFFIGQSCEVMGDIAAGNNENMQALELYKKALISYEKLGFEWGIKEKITKLEK